jgi:hypothetical protein
MIKLKQSLHGTLFMRPLTLSLAQQRRIAKLATLAGRTPEAMLRFVLRDGLEATARDVNETLEADEDIDRNGAIPHANVMSDARALIERHAAKRRRKAA